MRLLIRIFTFLVVGCALLIGITLAIPAIAIYFAAQDPKVQELAEKFTDKEKIGEVIGEGVQKAMSQPTLINTAYMPEGDAVIFSVAPEGIDITGANLGVYTGKMKEIKSREDMLRVELPLYTLPIVALPEINYPVILQKGTETYLKTVGENTVVTPEGQKTEKLKLYAAKLQSIPPGNYRLKLEQQFEETPSEGMKIILYTHVDVPERQPILKIDFVTQQPVTAAVGETFNYDLSVENRGVVSAKNTQLVVYMENQDLQSTQPTLAIAKENNKVTLLIPEIPPKAKFPIRLTFKAIAYDEEIDLGAEIADKVLAHPDQRSRDIRKRIGGIAPKSQ